MQEEWSDLLRSSSTNTIFVTPWWQRIWWRQFGGDWNLHIASVRDGGTTLGVAPMMTRNGLVRFVGETDLFDCLDFVAPEAHAHRFHSVLWDHLSTLDWHTLDLRSIPEASPTLNVLPEIAEGTGCSIEVSEEDKVPVAILPSTWEEYLSGLTKKHRHELRRKIRRLDRGGSVNQYACINAQDLSSCMSEFFRLYRLSGRDKAEFLTPERERFFSDIAIELAGRDQFRLYFLDLDGAPVASCICFDYDGSYLLYNSGYDPDYSGLSVGLLNNAWCIKDAIEGGRRSFEFLRGTERYKYELGGQNRSLYRMIVRR